MVTGRSFFPLAEASSLLTLAASCHLPGAGRSITLARLVADAANKLLKGKRSTRLVCVCPWSQHISTWLSGVVSIVLDATLL